MTVTFATKRKVRVFPKMTGEEKDLVWWTQEDIKTFRRQCYRSLRADSSNSNIGTTTLRSKSEPCMRGLEDWSKDKYTARRKRMRDAILGVILEQECLKNEGRTDEVRLAVQYARLAAESKRIAHSKGVMDAEFLGHKIEEVSRKSISPDRKRRNPFASALDTLKEHNPAVGRAGVQTFKKAIRRVSSS